jgi:hypothetical protein
MERTNWLPSCLELLVKMLRAIKGFREEYLA